ncbi:MAG: hypothetical protein CMJ65_03490 [Planctomycetaceae bacterium]|jgi:signal peptidase I|nr:hypothetical protein [Planctomycetaceae bacterium]MDP7278006.1 S26 family signal peptidase [Planctomycetaceae bacterium]
MARGGSAVRGLAELVTCIAIAVTLLKGFLVEGFLISTGSMAPQLLGFHKRVTCPECGFEFARGVNVDDPASRSPLATCINCGQTGIAITGVPRNEGDQLLVHKLPWVFSQVKRWEPIVFRRPGRATMAFVKRVIGLPGESVQIRGGDVHVDGRLCRKTLAQQRATRVPVYDDRFRPAGGSTRWTLGRGWSDTRGRFRFKPTQAATSWLEYHHLDVDQPGPVRDRYPYNPREPRSRTHRVRDLMLTLRAVESVGSNRPGRLRIELDSATHRVAWVRDLGRGRQWLEIDGRKGAPVGLTGGTAEKSRVLEFSTVDQTLQATADGRQVFPAYPLDTGKQPAVEDASGLERPLLRLGAAGGVLSITGIRIDRDVFYRGSPRQNATGTPWKLGPNEYFMLGDNSPVSLDSRSWSIPAVPARLIIGRPLLLHLPSRQWELRIGNSSRYIRIPDLGRIRYIR